MSSESASVILKTELNVEHEEDFSFKDLDQSEVKVEAIENFR